jgi:hypothetical protein
MKHKFKTLFIFLFVFTLVGAIFATDYVVRQAADVQVVEAASPACRYCNGNTCNSRAKPCSKKKNKCTKDADCNSEKSCSGAGACKNFNTCRCAKESLGSGGGASKCCKDDQAQYCCPSGYGWAHGGCCAIKNIFCGNYNNQSLRFCKGKDLSGYGNPVSNGKLDCLRCDPEGSF